MVKKKKKYHMLRLIKFVVHKPPSAQTESGQKEKQRQQAPADTYTKKTKVLFSFTRHLA